MVGDGHPYDKPAVGHVLGLINPKMRCNVVNRQTVVLDPVLEIPLRCWYLYRQMSCMQSVIDVTVTRICRIVHAPMTRCRASDGIPQPAIKLYYGQRASPGGLLVGEAAMVMPSESEYDFLFLNSPWF